MKKALLLILLAIFSGSLYAQQTMPKLVYDFSKGHFLDNDYIKNGKMLPMPNNSFAVIEVINVNTFRYRVEITGRSVDYVTQIPSELQAIFRQAKTNGNTAEGQEKGETAANMMTGLSNKASSEKNSIKKNIGQLKSKRSTIKQFTTKTTTKNNKKVTTQVANPEFTGIENEITEEEKKLTQQDKFAEAMEKLADACNEYVEVAKKVASIKFSRTELINLSKQDWPDFQSMQNSMPTELGRDEMRNSFDKFARYYAEAKSFYTNALLLAQSDEDKKKVENAQKLIEEGYHQITEDNYLKLIDDVYTLQEAMSLAKSFTVTSPPIQIDGDVVSFDIKAVPVKVNDLLNHTAEKIFRVEIPTKGGLKVDFSVGPVFSFGNSAKDDLYFLQPIANNPDSVTLTSRNNNNAVSPGIAAMMYAYPRGSRLAGCFGVGANVENFDNVKASFYLGVGTVLGKRQKITASLGVSFLRVDRLKDTEYETKRYKLSEISLGNVTEKVFKGSFFLSIGYNLSTRTEVK